jgi:cyanate permease
MNAFPVTHAAWRRWGVFGAVSLAFFFLNLATFTSLGVVLYTMVAELHWSQTAAGFSFSLLGMACGLTSPFGAVAMRWMGGRLTICAGALLLMIGFLLAAISQGIVAFYVAMVFLGLGYSLAGNIPGVYLIAGWFTQSSSRVIGLYLMLGALGAALGPPIVEAVVSVGGWRGHWAAMAVVALVVGVVALALVRTPPHVVAGETDRATNRFAADRKAFGWTPRQAVFTPQFMLVSAAMAMTMCCVTTLSSDTVTHLVKMGWATPTAAALVLSALGLTATLVKGGAGRLCELMPPTAILAAGLVLQAVGNLLFAHANTAVLSYAAALTFGTGWGLAYVAGTVVLLEYFGAVTGSKILSIVWLLTTVAAAGPLAAGRIADRTGSFSPIFIIYAGILLVLAVPTLIMREPAPHGSTEPAAG